MSIDLEKEREAFENIYNVKGAYYEKQGGYYSTPQDLDDVGFEVEYKWDAWQERANISQAEINDLKQQIAELHASRESLLEYKNKVESIESNRELD